MEINYELIDETAIKQEVDKVAINTAPADNKEIVSYKEIAKEIRPDDIQPLSLTILEADGRAAVYQILERQKMNNMAKSVLGMHTIILNE